MGPHNTVQNMAPKMEHLHRSVHAKERRERVQVKNLKVCISAAQMFANKLEPGPKKADHCRLFEPSTLLRHSQNTFSTNNVGVHTDWTYYMVVTLCTIIWILIRCSCITELLSQQGFKYERKSKLTEHNIV